MRYPVIAAILSLLPTAVHAQDKAAAAQQELAEQAAEAKAAAASGKQNFGGIDFGIGISMSYDLGNHDRVREATIVDGIVRVAHTDNIRARLILEWHYFFTPTFSNQRRVEDEAYCAGFRSDATQYRNCRASLKDFGIGPFVALQPGSDKVIDAIGAGLMVGFRRTDVRTSSFNLGIGIFYDVDTQILGDGFAENRPPPGSETEVRFRRQSQSGLLLMSSYTF